MAQNMSAIDREGADKLTDQHLDEMLTWSDQSFDEDGCAGRDERDLYAGTEYVPQLVTVLRKERAENAALVDRMAEALIWCSGSEDFAPGGKARVGWLKLCKPLLDDLLALAGRGAGGDDAD